MEATKFEKECFAIEKIEKDGKDRVTVGLMTVGGVDSDGEIVDQTSALEAMPRFAAAGGPVTFNHGSGGNVGRMLEYQGVRRHGSRWVETEDAKRVQAIRVTTLYGKGYGINTVWGPMSVDDVWAMIDQGMLATHSIGFLGRREPSGPGEAPRVLVERVLEYGVVTVPAHEAATLEVQRQLKAAQLCPECAKRLGLDGVPVAKPKSCDAGIETVARALRDFGRILQG